MQTVHCGYYELPSDQTFHYAGYECAAWSVDTLVPAGRYPVIAYVENGHVKEFVATLTGTVVSDYFQALYFGMPIGDPYDTKKNAGNPSDYRVRAYSYDVPRDKSGRWHVDYSALPNVGHCIHCGTITFGYENYGWILCADCSGYVHKGDEIMATLRFPRLLKVLSHGGEFGTMASNTLAQAFYDRSDYHRNQISKVVRRVRAARRQFGRPETHYFAVYEDGTVNADGRRLGRITIN